MRVIKRPSGRPLGLLDAGERMPADAPPWVLRKSGDYWYQIRPSTSDDRPRDPKTGDPLPRGSQKAKLTKMSAKTSERHERQRGQGASERRIKEVHAVAKKRTAAKGKVRKP
jgi:hypothetical protein